MRYEIAITGVDDDGNEVELTAEEQSEGIVAAFQQRVLDCPTHKAVARMLRVMSRGERRGVRMASLARELVETFRKAKAALDARRAALERFAAEPVEVMTVQRGTDGRTHRVIKAVSTRGAVAALSLPAD